jgi:hypothetical protein
MKSLRKINPTAPRLTLDKDIWRRFALAQGKTPEQIVAELPGLTLDNVHEAEVYAEVTQAQPQRARIWGQGQ